MKISLKKIINIVGLIGCTVMFSMCPLRSLCMGSAPQIDSAERGEEALGAAHGVRKQIEQRNARIAAILDETEEAGTAAASASGESGATGQVIGGAATGGLAAAGDALAGDVAGDALAGDVASETPGRRWVAEPIYGPRMSRTPSGRLPADVMTRPEIVPPEAPSEVQDPRLRAGWRNIARQLNDPATREGALQNPIHRNFLTTSDVNVRLGVVETTITQ